MTRPTLVRILGRQYLLPTWYPAPLVTGLALLDQVRHLLGTSAGSPIVPDLTRATIVIAKPDHFGDLLQATALFRAFRERLPHATLVLVHGSWAAPLAAWLVEHGYVDELVTYDAMWLQPAGTPWRTRFSVERATRTSAASALRRLNPTAYLDIRCTSPGSLDLAIESGAPLRVGFGLRGRSWEYHRLIPYRSAASLGQNWMHVLDVLGLPPATYVGPVLPPAPPLASDAPIIVQPGSRSQAKEAPAAVWRALLPQLAQRAPVLLVGSMDDRDRFAWLRDLIPAERRRDAMGATSLTELIALSGTARAAVGVESMVAHLAVGHGRPTVVLNSPKASGSVAFPDGMPSLTILDMTLDPQQVASAALSHLDRCLA